MAATSHAADARRAPRVLVLSRSYPNDVLPTLGLWVEQPTSHLAEFFDVQVVSPVPWCPPLPDVGPARQFVRFRRIRRLERRGNVDVAHPRFLIAPGQALYSLEARAYHRGVRGLIDELHRARPFDIVHAHFVYPDGVVGHRLAERYALPLVITEHAPWTGWLDRRGVARQALPAASAAAAVLPVSTSVARTIHAYAGNGVSTEVIPVGVDGTVFRPSAETMRRPDQVLFVGFVNYMKGVDVLLDAVLRLVSRGKDVRLVLVGGAHYRDTQRQETELRALATSLGLDDRVSFLGKQPREEVARLMRESAVLVLPSRAESFGAVLVEALACGTPVIASRSGGPEDIVTDDVGLLVPREDPEALAVAIDHVLDHGDRYDPALLRSYAVRHFGAPSVAARIGAVYERVLTGAR